MRIGTPAFAASLALLATTLLTAPLVGQDRIPKRSLGGHNFIPNELLGDAFVGTYVRNSTGAGTAMGLTVAIPDLEGGVSGFTEAELGFITFGVEYQQNITNWLAFRVGGSGGARLGTSVEALLAEGATAVFGYNFGLAAKVVRSERFALGASVDVLPNKAYGISPLDFAKSVIDNGLDSTSSLLRKGNGSRVSVGLHPAWVVTPWLGLLGQVEVGPNKRRTDEENEAMEEEESDTQTTLGLGTSINLMGASNTPLGFTVAYQHKGGLVSNGDVAGGADTWNLGVYYTGHRSFIVGLDFVSSRLEQALTDDKIDLIGARLTLRYDFR